MADLSPEELLARGFSRETKIARDARGRWSVEGDAITHPKLAHAFDTWVERAPDGRFCLKNSIHWVYVSIDGAPIFVRAVTVDAAGIHLTLSDDRVELLDASTLRVDAEGLIYCTVRDGSMPAQFDAHAACQLSDQLEDSELGAVLHVGSTRIVLPVTDHPLQWP